MCLIEHLLSPGLSSLNSVFQRLLSVIVFVPVFPGEISFPSPAQAVHLPGQLPAVALSPLAGHSCGCPRKRSCGTAWEKMGRTTFLGDSHCSDIGSIRPSISYTDPSFYVVWMSGFWSSLLAEGLHPGGSYGGCQCFSAIRVGW